MVGKHAIGIAVNSPYSDSYSDNDVNNSAIIIVELIDVNDKLNHSEIKTRTKLRPGEEKAKYLFAYSFYRSDKGEEVQILRNEALSNRVAISGLDEHDEVESIKKLYHDLKRRILFF